MSQTQSYQVRGMTCGHCVGAVTGELETLDGVTSVTISLVPHGNSTVTVTSSVQLARDAMHEAIERAGYELIDAP